MIYMIETSFLQVTYHSLPGGNPLNDKSKKDELEKEKERKKEKAGKTDPPHS